MHFRIEQTGPNGRQHPHVYYDAGGERPATDTEIALRDRIAALETVLGDLLDSYEYERIRIGAGNADRPSVSGQTVIDRAIRVLAGT